MEVLYLSVKVLIKLDQLGDLILHDATLSLALLLSEVVGGQGRQTMLGGGS